MVCTVALLHTSVREMGRLLDNACNRIRAVYKVIVTDSWKSSKLKSQDF